ncbi:MAG: ferredoxin--NADP reductase [Ignavibacteria bacterium]|nr:ferredoxin--NADP reductase [Ignavibacteria bacterium]
METSEYNSTVVGKILLTPDLMILRIHTDEPRPKFEAGQFTQIGLLSSEPRSANSVPIREDIAPGKIIKRPYSIASANHETQNFEFYISQVKSGQLTPRLFNLSLGSRIWVDTRIIGLFKLNETPKECDIVMIATGTGLAPYISFLRSHILENQHRKLAVIHGASYPWDLGYFSELTFLKFTFNNFYYFPTLIHADKEWTGLRGYIEEHLQNDLLQKEAGIEIDPNKTHIYVCGNPKMVESVSNFLKQFNYIRHTKTRPGSLHVEEY